MKRNTKNKIYTPGYFLKRLKDNNFIVLKMFQGYKESDPRRWTVLIDPDGAAVFVTCFENKIYQEILFAFEDGDNLFPKSYRVKTDSIEVIVQELIDRGVGQAQPGDLYYKEKSLNTNNDRRPDTTP